MKTFKGISFAAALWAAGLAGYAQTEPVQLQVDAGQQIATVTKLFNGTNI